MTSNATAGRIDRLSPDVRGLADRIADDLVDDALGRLAVVVVDVTDIGGVESVRDAMTQWQTTGRVSKDTRKRLDAAMVQRDVDGLAAHRAGDAFTQRVHFRAARGLTCLAIIFDADIVARRRMREAVYEASVALGGSAGVVGVLVDFTRPGARVPVGAPYQ